MGEEGNPRCSRGDGGQLTESLSLLMRKMRDGMKSVVLTITSPVKLKKIKLPGAQTWRL